MDRPEELRLIRRAKRGDRSAIEALVEGHRPRLHHFLLRLTRCEQLADDVAQDAFVRVLKHLDRFDERFRFSTWLFTIARRLWINHIQKFRPVSDSDMVEARASADRSAGEVERKEDRIRSEDAVSRGLDCLNPRQREVVELFYGRDLPIQEIAARLQLPVGTVKSHLFRGRARIARHLVEEDSFPELALDLELDWDPDASHPPRGGGSFEVETRR
jgi:RNA polymerase sigma-70 factor (ECF subfamily)